jgi:methylated-DNA-[protein]-cysteine S-methyltransferase
MPPSIYGPLKEAAPKSLASRTLITHQKGPDMSLAYKTMESPVGKLKLVASNEGLVAVLWQNDRPSRMRVGELVEDDEHPILLKAERQLGEYFAGKRKEFEVPLDMRGTSFQKNVWEALLAIPFGETRSYGQLAKQLGNPNATRAVGAANGRNPLSIIVPCHRVIGSTGKLTGFGGGLETKAHLLNLEGNGSTLFSQETPK